MEKRIKLLESLTNNLPVLTVIVNSEARVLNINGSFGNNFFTVDSEIKDLLLGNVLSCVNSLGGTDKCGHSLHCNDCILRTSLDDVIKTGNVVFRKQGPFTFTTPDGPKTLFLQVSAARLEDYDENTYALFISDDTEFKKIENRLAENQALLNLVFEHSSDWEIYRDQDLNLVYCSKAVEDIIGYTVQEYVSGKVGFRDFIHPEDYERAMMAIKNSQKIESKNSYEFRYIHKSGKIVWVNVSARRVFSEDGTHIGFRLSTRDITENKLIAEKLKESEEKYRFAEQLALIGHFDFDLRNNTISWSEGMYRIFETTPDKIKPDFNSFIAYVHPEDREMVETTFQKSLLKREPSEMSHRIVLKDGKVKHLRQSYRIIFGDDGKSRFAFGTTKDISHQVEAEKKLIQLIATKDKFFSIISHDLKSPFSILLGMSQALLDNEEILDDADKKEFIQSIYDTSKKTYELLEDLLTWSRSQTGAISFNPERFSLADAVNDVVMFLEHNAENKGINLVSNVSSDTSVFGDYKMIGTIIRNLVSNSIKYTPSGGTITVDSAAAGDMVEISVTDTGIGMDEKVLNSLFKIEQTMSRPGTNKEEGTGLGLLLCREFVHRHGGKIWVESEVGKGSRFVFTVGR
jgi:PAS domain S-box-containing protein